MSAFTTTRVVTVRMRRGPGSVKGVIEITIDLDSVARQLADRAFESKGRKSRYMNGAIVGKAHSVEVQP